MTLLPPIHPPALKQVRKRLSLRSQLLAAVNGVLLVGLIVVLFFDYRTETADRLRGKQTALQDEAVLLLPMIERLRHHGVEAVQEYVNAACGQMQETTSPGHHIAVTVGSSTVQAQTHHGVSPRIFEAMRAGRSAVDHRADIDGRPILVGSASRGDMDIYVSEYVGQVLQDSRRQLMQRSLRIGLLGLLGTLVADLVLVRLLVRPVDRLVATVRRIGGGGLGMKVQGLGSAEFQYLADEINVMSSSLAAVEADRRRQMDKARAIQQRLHPSAVDVAGWRIASIYQPADEVGGDYFDLHPVGGRLLVVCIADVTGHGVAAAMGAAMLKTLFGAAVEQDQDPARILHRINRGFLTVSLEGDFASMTVAVLDRATGRVRYASAGHEPGYVVSSDGQIQPLEGTGLLLGIEASARWDVAELTIGSGDHLVLLTDGWAETLTTEGKLLGREALQATLREAAGLAPEQLVQRMMDRARVAGGQRRQADDLTLLVVQRASRADAAATRTGGACVSEGL